MLGSLRIPSLPSLGSRWDRELLGLGLVLIGIVIIAGIATDWLFFDPLNIRNMLLRACIVGVVSVGQAFVMLSAGIDLSVGGSLILASCIGAALMTTDPRLTLAVGDPLPVAAGFVIIVLVAAVIGAINGLAVTRLRMPALIVTLAVWQLTFGAAYQATTHGQLIASLPESVGVLGQGSTGGVPNPIIVFVVVVIAGYYILGHTSFGRSVYAIGGSETSAWLSGINVRRVRTWVYIVCGVCVGIGALMALSRTSCASIRMVQGLEMDSIAAVVIGGVSLFGGKGSIIGVLLGVLILSVINNTMTLTGVMSFHQEVIRGAVILFAVTASYFANRRFRPQTAG